MTTSTETREQANRSRVASRLAKVMRAKGISANDARLAGDTGNTPEQAVAAINFRRATGWAAGQPNLYVASDATWSEACRLLEFAEEVAK